MLYCTVAFLAATRVFLSGTYLKQSVWLKKLDLQVKKDGIVISFDRDALNLVLFLATVEKILSSAALLCGNTKINFAT